ncbi:MAG: rRNA maturation RNase YbeY [Bryobacteraceae bacterium]|jgi:probable rRNA maturation factor
MPESASTLMFRRAPRGLPHRGLQAFATLLERMVADGRHFGCLLTDDRELRRLNRQFLDRDYPTDVLSFPAAAPAEFLGEIAISTTRAAKQAREQGHSLEQEIGVLMLHGLLHLLGMDHERDQGRMERTERRYREELGLPVGLIERARARAAPAGGLRPKSADGRDSGP